MFICNSMPIKILFSPCESDKLLSWLLKTQWQWSLMTNEQINSKSSSFPFYFLEEINS